MFAARKRIGNGSVVGAGVWLLACVLPGGGALPAQAATGPVAAAAEMLKPAGGGTGLCVHLGCGDGSGTVELARRGTFLVHGLSDRPEMVERARRRLQAEGLYGKAAVDLARFDRLPYEDDLVNLLVVDDAAAPPAGTLSLAEVMRVLRPGGAAVFGGAGPAAGEALQKALQAAGGGFVVVSQAAAVLTIRKTWPEDLDHWTHYQYDGGQTRVSRDRRLGPPFGYRWIAGPTWPINGPKMSSSNRGMLSVDGVMYYVTTNVPANVQTHPRKVDDRVVAHHVMARDGFNGMIRWCRPLAEYEKAAGIVRPAGEDPAHAVSVAQWFGHSMVTDGKRLYGGLRGTLLAIDVKTGDLAKVFLQNVPHKDSLACEGSSLMMVGHQGLYVFDTGTGRLKWKLDQSPGRAFVGNGRIIYNLADQMICADLETGGVRWRQPAPRGHLEFYKSNIVFTHAGPGNQLNAFSADDGKHLWTFSGNIGPAESLGIGHSFFMKDLIWIKGGVGKTSQAEKRQLLGGVNPLTGKLEKRWPTNIYLKGAVCRHGISIATERQVIVARPMNLIEPDAGREFELREGRHACGLGLRVANGLLYTAPQGCQCMLTTVRGFLAVGRGREWGRDEEGALVKGPAFGAIPQSAIHNPQSDWPTFRHDPRRSGGTAQKIGSDLRLLWTAEPADQKPADGPLREEWLMDLSGDARLTAPVAAGGKVFVGVPDAHQVVALDAGSGKPLWRFTAGGRVVVPPTIHDGLCLVGARDGWVYCLLAEDGRLVWRLRAAPAEARIMAYGQLESPWPVVGGVLVEGGLAYVMAGRSHSIGGGSRFLAIDPASGAVRRADRHNAYGIYSQLLVSDGAAVMTADGLLKQPLAGATGQPADALAAQQNVFDRSWHRLGLSVRVSAVKGGAGWSNHLNLRGLAGTLVAGSPDRQTAFAYRMIDQRIKPGKQPRQPAPAMRQHNYLVAGEKGKQVWSVDVPDPVQFEAMASTPEVLLAAGLKDVSDRSGQGILMALATRDGARLAQLTLDSGPAAEGLAVAHGRVYLATRDGKLLCFDAPPAAAGR